MKKFTVFIIFALLSIGAIAQRIESKHAYFDNDSGEFESQPSFLPNEWQPYDMVVVRKDDPFLDAGDYRDNFVKFFFGHRSRVTAYVFCGNVPSSTRRVAQDYCEQIIDIFSTAWGMNRKASKDGIGVHALDRHFFGKMGDINELITKKVSTVTFMGDANATKISYTIAMSKSEIVRTLGITYDFHFSAYCYYDKATNKSVAAIFYKVGANKEIMADPTTRASIYKVIVSLMPSGKKEEVESVWNRLANDKMTDMEGAFARYFHLKKECIDKPPLADSIVIIIGEENPPVDTIEIIVDTLPNPKKASRFSSCGAIDIDESETALFVLLSNGRIMRIDKKFGNIEFPYNIDKIGSIAYVGDTLFRYILEVGVISPYSDKPIWTPVDPKAKFSIHPTADGKHIIAKGEQWIVVLSDKGEELYAYETTTEPKYMCVDNSGKIWHSGEDRTIRYAQGETLGNYITLSQKSYGVHSLTRRGNSVAISTADGVVVPNIEQSSIEQIIPAQPTIGAMYHTATNSKGEIFGIAFHSGLWRYRPGVDTQFQLLTHNVWHKPVPIQHFSHDTTNFIYIDSLDNLWISNGLHLYLYNPDVVKGYARLGGEIINTVK